MQRHKKYLVTTLWVSVIAFVGAGFVGWGSYSYNKKDRVIMTVGNIDVSMEDFQVTYSNIYSYYAQMFQGQFDEAKAQELGLQLQALNVIKKEALLLNLAKDYGLVVLDKEVANLIYTNPAFLKEGNFSRETYESLLKNIKMTPKDYEARLKRDLLVSKVSDLLSLKLTPLEKELFHNIFTIADKLEYKVISKSDVKIEISDLKEDEIKAFWELNKNRYLTEKSYTVSYLTQEISSDDFSDEDIQAYFNENSFKFKDEEEKIPEEITEEIKTAILLELNKEASEKLAIKKYIDFKKGKFDGQVKTKEVFASMDLEFSQELVQEIDLLTQEDSKYLKPRFNDIKDEFYIIKLDEVKEPVPSDYEDAKFDAQLDLLTQKENEALQNFAKNSVETFTGEETEFLTIRDAYLLNSLSYNEANEFLSSVFKQSATSGFIPLNSAEEQKFVLYKVKEQKMLNSSSENLDSLAEQDFEWIQNLKTELINNSLYKKLENYYHIEEFYSKG